MYKMDLETWHVFWVYVSEIQMKYKLYLWIVLLILFSQLVQPQLKQQGWTHYRNERWAFCVSFPRTWGHDEGVNKAGIAISPPRTHSTGLEPQISVGVLPTGRSNDRFLSLEEGFVGEDAILRESGATELVVLDKHNTAVGSHVALFFELKCGPSELAHLEVVFNEIVFNTFRINCVDKSTSKRINDSQAEKQDIFVHVKSSLLKQTQVPLRLPGFLPAIGDKDSPVHVILESVSKRGYKIQLAWTEDCDGGNSCHYGAIRGSLDPLVEEQRKRVLVILKGGIKGYFIPFECGAHCDDSSVGWSENGYQYSISLKAENIKR